MYLIPNICRTKLQYDLTIGTILNYLKLPFIRCRIFERIIIIDNDFISNRIVVVYYFTIFADVIFINLCLILLTHYFLIYLVLNQYNHIMDKF